MTRRVIPPPPLAPDHLDGGRPQVGRPEKMWGASIIAGHLGLSVDTIRRLARDPDVPIFRPGGRYFAFRSELDRWLRTKPPA